MTLGWRSHCVVLVVLASTGCTMAGAPAPRPEKAIVAISASGCAATDTRATGWLTDRGLVVTVAHAVRGSTAVRTDGFPARVVAIDNRTDVAVLIPERALGTNGLTLAPGVSASSVWLARFNGTTPTVTHTSASGVVIATIDEPVDATTYSREAFSVRLAVDHGDSGAPVVDGRGRLVGMAFATARDGSDLAYAVGVDDIRTALQDLDAGATAVETGRCR